MGKPSFTPEDFVAFYYSQEWPERIAACANAKLKEMNGALTFDQIEWLKAFYERSTGLRAQDIDVNEPEFVDFDFGG